ncbi:hypothetical protein [Teredinibacter sp. KSP-S5-2]|uniref:hypothetical protein n=1 Tax=Teredinibacter sp. KSP-S5-2 TaxID=3034506 RepID=UPI002934DDC0|nr:hypothetical protein [Teredinibacter sp. KSP-S5-2]WNO07603.1 hypothetical protein P5V12_11435 [Teredinibacter sp. KSP-S5-2]
MSLVEIYMVVGFMLAAYSIVANDSIQTLGTFIASNCRRPWWVLWCFSSIVLVIVVVYGWYTHGGDPAYGRLEKFPVPELGLQWFHVIPPLVILLLTRYGVPVSTTFLILAVFNPKNINVMLLKSGIGYLVAFVIAIVIYRFVINKTTEYFEKTKGQPIETYWVVLQWGATAFLWSQWLIQDLANIFVYAPRIMSIEVLVLALLLLVALQGAIFFQMGGAIQKIVSEKTGTADIRSATIIDFIYAIILLVFKEWSNMPMSTTWVFLGLLAGRQFAISWHMFIPPIKDTTHLVVKDIFKALTGLIVSIVLALGLPMLA